MLQPLADLPPGIDGSRALGVVTGVEVAAALGPLLEEARRTGRGLRWLVELGPGMDEAEAAAAWEQIRQSVQQLPDIDGCALVTDLAWVRRATALVRAELPRPLRAFPPDQRDAAVAWLRALPDRGRSRGAGGRAP